MGSIAYDFLANSILFNEYELEHGYPSLKDSQLEHLIQDYREHCLKNIETLQSEVISTNSSLKVLSSLHDIPLNMLKQGALYYDQFVINDPLFALSTPVSEASNTTSKFLGYADLGLSREEIVENTRKLKSLTPMVVSDYVKLLPMRKLFEPPTEVPIYLPVNNNEDDLPKELLDFCKKYVTVESMMPANDGCGWTILEGKKFTPGILVSFGQWMMNFHLLEQEIINVDRNSNTYSTHLRLADYPVDERKWKVWVQQSVNRSAFHYVNQTITENVLAKSLNANYLTDNTVTADLLRQVFSVSESVESACASQFINLELPFLDKINLTKLMTVRVNEAEALVAFREEMERCLRELRGLKDEDIQKIRKEDILHELKLRVSEIDKKLKSLRQKGYIDAVIMLAGLAATVQTSGWSLLAAATAMAQGCKTVFDYCNGIKENPMYFLWKVLK